MKKSTFKVLSCIPFIGPIIKHCLTSDFVTLNSTAFRFDNPDEYFKIQKGLNEFAEKHKDTAITNEVLKIVREQL